MAAMARLVPTLLALAVALSACSSDRGASGRDTTPPGNAASAPRLIQRSRTSMGSPVDLSAWTARETAALAAFEEVFNEFDRLDSLLSVWKEGSDVLRLNANAGRDPVAISHDTMAVLRHARQGSEWTAGKFDVTFGALSDVWKFDHDQDDRIPTPAEIAARLPLGGLPRHRPRRSRGHGAADTGGRARAPGRRGQGVRRGPRRGDPAVAWPDRLHGAVGRRPLRGRSQGRSAVAGRRPRSAWSRRQRVRHAGALRLHLQHVGRLRALLHPGRRPLSPHAGPRLGPAGTRRAQRDHRGAHRPSWPTCCRPASSCPAPRPAWRSSNGCPTSKA